MAVLDAPSAEQAGVLERMTADQPALRAEVQSLLSYDKDSPLPAIISNTWAAVPNYRPGEQLGPYQLVMPMSVRSESEVWCGEACDDRSRVAIKILLDETGSRLERFERESRMLAKLRHPNIASWIQAGSTSMGHPFIAMHFVDGSPVTEFADEKQLTIRERLQLMIKVCDAVSYAHRFLIVHRDLKPSNILVTHDGQPVVLDFGIASFVRRGSEVVGRQSQLTATMERPMTPAYAAAEQARGEAITTATDVHGLGLLLYELLTGHHPYSDAAHPQTDQLFDRICESLPRLPSQVVTTDALPLDQSEEPRSARLVAALRRVAPGALSRTLRKRADAVIMKAISKQPEGRYASVAELEQDLCNLVEGRPVLAQASRRNLARIVVQRPLAFLAVTCVMSAVVTGMLMFAYARREMVYLKGNATQAAKALAEVKQLLAQAEQERRQQRTSEEALGAAVADYLSPAGPTLPLPATVSPSLRVALARMCAADGRASIATRLMQAIDAKELDDAGRVAAADVWSQLGRPTAGLAALQEVKLDELSGDLRGQAAMTRANLLVAAQRFEAAYQLEAEVEDVAHIVPRQLTLAEMRFRIGWMDGARQSLEPLMADSELTTIPAPHGGRAKLLDALVKIKDSDPPNPEALRQLCEMEMWEDSRLEVVRCQALLELGRFYLADRQQGLAEDAFRQGHRRMVEMELADHAIAQQCAASLIEAFRVDAPAAAEERQKMCYEFWDRALETGELGTMTAARVAATLMSLSNDPAMNVEVLDQLEPYREGLSEDTYADRNLLAHELTACVATSRWERAGKSASRLEQIETKLWGKQSIEVALTVAAQALVAEKRNQSGDANALRQQARSIVREFAETEQRPLPKLFLLPVVSNWSSEYSIYDWIYVYKMQRDNSDATLIEMLAFTVGDCGQDANGRPSEAAIELSRATLATEEWKPTEQFEQAQRFREVIAASKDD